MDRLLQLNRLFIAKRNLCNITLHIVALCLSVWLFNQSSALAVVGSHLTREEKKRVEHFLHPLPQELHIGETKYALNGQNIEIQYQPSDRKEVDSIISDFETRLNHRFDLLQADKNGSESNSLIIIPVLANVPLVGDVAIQDRVNYASSRPNFKQAYSIVTIPQENCLTLYVIANDTPGLYYGFLTLEQLISSLSNNSTIVYPQVNIVDWPDVRQRGSWTVLTHRGNDQKAINGYTKTLETVSQWKMNYVEAWHLFAEVDAKSNAVYAKWPFPVEVISIGERFAVTVFPGTGHLGQRFKNSAIKKKYPDAIGTAPQKLESRSLCYSTPQTQQMLDEYFLSIANQFDFAEIWLTELEGPRGVCQCKECKGDSRRAFVKEIQHVVSAYHKAKEVHPKFNIVIGLTQGTYPHNFAMLRHIPKEIPLNFYNGKMTYKAHFQKYNLPPSVTEIQRLGYTVGSTPSPVETYMMFPFQTPQYCRLLAGEAEDRSLDFVLAQFYPTPIVNDFNAQAYSEFLWNSNGRSAYEATLSWATRKGLSNPEEVAAIIGMLEYASLGLHNIKAGNLIDAVAELLEEEQEAGVLEHVQRGLQKIKPEKVKDTVGIFVKEQLGVSTKVYSQFEYTTHEEISRILAISKEASVRAKLLNNGQLYNGSALLTNWIVILERYAFLVENKRDEEDTAKVIEEITYAIQAMPELHRNWIDSMEIPGQYINIIDKQFNYTFRKWQLN